MGWEVVCGGYQEDWLYRLYLARLLRLVQCSGWPAGGDSSGCMSVAVNESI